MTLNHLNVNSLREEILDAKWKDIFVPSTPNKKLK